MLPKSLKSKARCEEKAEDDYEGDLSRLFDVARASVKCSTATQLLNLYQGFRKQQIDMNTQTKHINDIRYAQQTHI